VYQKGGLDGLDKEKERDFQLNQVDLFMYRTRYFTDSGIIGTKAFIECHFQRFKGHFECKHDKRGNAIPGLGGDLLDEVSVRENVGRIGTACRPQFSPITSLGINSLPMLQYFINNRICHIEVLFSERVWFNSAINFPSQSH